LALPPDTKRKRVIVEKTGATKERGKEQRAAEGAERNLGFVSVGGTIRKKPEAQLGGGPRGGQNGEKLPRKIGGPQPGGVRCTRLHCQKRGYETWGKPLNN